MIEFFLKTIYALLCNLSRYVNELWWVSRGYCAFANMDLGILCSLLALIRFFDINVLKEKSGMQLRYFRRKHSGIHRSVSDK